jgi:hypothetical protein
MSIPTMNSVSSSNIESIGYDAGEETVYVQFLNGSMYTYKGVPEHEYYNLSEATSLGSYLHRNYKNVYPFEKIA